MAPIASDILFEAIPDPVIAVDGAGWVLELNSAARDLPGMAAEPVGAPIAGPAELVETLPLRPSANAVDRFEIAVAANGRSYEVFRRRSPAAATAAACWCCATSPRAAQFARS